MRITLSVLFSAWALLSCQSVSSVSGEPIIRPNKASIIVDKESQLYKIERTAEEDGSVTVKILGASKEVLFTTDGSLPAAGNKNTFTYSAPVNLRKVTIFRATSGNNSVVRSVSILPRLWTASVTKLPRTRKNIKAVYLTGAFRNWSQSFDENYRLLEKQSGVLSRDVVVDRASSVQYKYLARLDDDSIIWFTNEDEPQSGTAPYNNNILSSHTTLLSRLYKTGHDGFIEEAAIRRDDSAIAAIDAGENLVRLSLTLLDSDVEKVKVRFQNTSDVTLAKSTFEEDGITLATYSGLVELPKSELASSYFVILEDGGKSFLLGQNGLQHFNTELPWQDANLFVYDPDTQLLNGKEIYQIPLWAMDAIWYQIFPERFRNGDISNDIPGGYPLEWHRAYSELSKLTQKVSEWTSSWFTFTPVELKTKEIIKNHFPQLALNEIEAQIIRNRRYGGDLKGIEDSIPYLKSVGVNAIYLNPVFESDSEHKYDTKDYRHIDPDLGPMTTNGNGEKDISDEDKELLKSEDLLDPATWKYTSADKQFMQLVTKLQNQGFRVVIDGVFNHSAVNSRLMEDIATYGRDSRFYDWFESAYEGDANYNNFTCNLSTFFPNKNSYPHASKIRFNGWFGFCTLPNHREGYPDGSFHPELKQYFFDITTRWLKPQTIDGIEFRGMDGMRFDVYSDVSSNFWRQLRTHMKSIKRDSFLIAEEWHNGFSFLQGDEVDSIMNYNIRTLVESWFLNVNPTSKFRPSWAKNFMDARTNNYRSHVNYGLWSMLSSHDTDRVISKTHLHNRALIVKPEENNSWDSESQNRPDKGAPYSNDKPGFFEKQLYKAIVGFQFAYIGSPVVYYGDEVGMWGADDPTNRKPMVWNDLGQGKQFETRCASVPGRFCKEIPTEKFSVEQDEDMLVMFQRLTKARKDHPALRRGKVSTSLAALVDGHAMVLGSEESNPHFLWGFERSFADKNFAYFISNTNQSKENQTLTLRTRFVPGSKALDLIYGNTYNVSEDGNIELGLGRDRALLLVQAN